MDSINATPGTYEVREGPTPHGGVRIAAFYYDAEDHPCSKSNAEKVQILEYDSSGVCIFSLISEG